MYPQTTERIYEFFVVGSLVINSRMPTINRLYLHMVFYLLDVQLQLEKFLFFFWVGPPGLPIMFFFWVGPPRLPIMFFFGWARPDSP